MKEILRQQGNQADKLLPQVFDELSRGVFHKRHIR